MLKQTNFGFMLFIKLCMKNSKIKLIFLDKNSKKTNNTVQENKRTMQISPRLIGSAQGKPFYVD